MSSNARFGCTSEAVIDGTDVCAPDSSYTCTIFGMSVLNGWGLVSDRVNAQAPVGRLPGNDP